MGVGFTLYTNKADETAAICEHAEAVGFDRVWAGEHIVAPIGEAQEHPYGGRQRPPVVPSDNRFYDIWLVIGGILERTRKMTVCTGVYLLPLRHPLITARACLTAQTISNGRFCLGAGIGWLESEFAALGIPFKQRAARFDEAVEVLRKVFAGGPTKHEGRFYAYPQLQMTDAPVRVPIVIGGKTPGAMRRAAALGDGWVGIPIPFSETLMIRSEIERIRGELGLSGCPFAYYPRLFEDADGDSLSRFKDAGFDDLVITFDMLHPEDPRETSMDFKRRRFETFAKRIGLKP